MELEKNRKESDLESKFRQEQSQFNKEREKDTQPDLCKVEKLEVLDI